jgi:hypothetical protein
MKPVYFPFTHIAAPVAEAACCCFGGLVLHRPLKQDLPAPLAALAQRLSVDIRVPDREDDEQLNNLYHAYRKWCDFHEGGIGLLKNRFNGIDDAEIFVTQIRSEILERRSRETAAPDPLLSARLFLLAAQDYDMAQETVDHAIAVSESGMARMVAALKGDAAPGGDAQNYSSTDDPGALMTGARLLSWYRLASAGADTDFNFLITTSPAVCEALVNHAPSGRLVQSLDGVPSPQDSGQQALWAAYLADAAAAKPQEGGGLSPPELPVAFAENFVFSLYLFPELTLEQLLNLTLSGQEMSYTIQSGIRNILVGLLETKKSKKRVLDSIL